MKHDTHADGDVDTSTNLPHSSLLQKENSDNKSSVLSAARSASTIPRSLPDESQADSTTWMYPSPRMFYNALKRKGFDTEPEDIESMVQVHNFLNEAVWQEVEEWESMHKSVCPGPKLKRFMGRPSDLSPKAWLYTNIYGGQRPFDRHDWTVDRCGKEIRYVIDYYSAGKDQHGMPVFSVDVRPALDSVSAVVDRIRMAWKSFTDPPS